MTSAGGYCWLAYTCHDTWFILTDVPSYLQHDRETSIKLHSVLLKTY